MKSIVLLLLFVVAAIAIGTFGDYEKSPPGFSYENVACIDIDQNSTLIEVIEQTTSPFYYRQEETNYLNDPVFVYSKLRWQDSKLFINNKLKNTTSHIRQTVLNPPKLC